MSSSRLQLYNSALIICGERILASLTENREPRYLLDHVWSNDGVRSCLESAQWKFAMRTQMLDYNPSIEPEFGYIRAFTKPSDWVRTSAVCSDPYFQVPLNRMVDETGYWYSDLDTIYVRFISDDSGYGGDLSLWPGSFQNYVAASFASDIILKLTSDKERHQIVEKTLEKNLKIARSRDAVGGPTLFPPQGSWSAARRGRWSRNDGGNTGSLTG